MSGDLVCSRCRFVWRDAVATTPQPAACPVCGSRLAPPETLPRLQEQHSARVAWYAGVSEKLTAASITCLLGLLLTWVLSPIGSSIGFPVEKVLYPCGITLGLAGLAFGVVALERGRNLARGSRDGAISVGATVLALFTLSLWWVWTWLQNFR